MAQPASVHPLHRASGSATYTSPTSNLTILSAVNFPLEVPRRSDELPTSLLIDVNVRPHTGVGAVKARHLEELVRRTLQAVVLVEDYPRSLMQVGLQVLRGEGDLEDGLAEGEGYLGELGGLLNASCLGALEAGVGMKEVYVAVLVGIGQDGSAHVQPTVDLRRTCKSLHLFCFGGGGGMLLGESEGSFGIEDWERAEVLAKQACLGRPGAVETTSEQTGKSLVDDFREAVEHRVAVENRWRGS